MKILKIVAVTVIVQFCAVNANSQDKSVIDTTYTNSHYENRLEFFKKMPNRKNEIVFVGNSITEGGKWQELFITKNVINRGISGDVTYGILARLNEIIESKPKKIFLLCGINDMKRGIPNDIIANNIQRMIHKIKKESPKTEIYLQSILPVNETMLPKTYSLINNDKITDLNEKLKLASLQDKVTYVNLQPVLSDENGSLKKELCIDGLHLKQASYILWANQLKKLKLIK